MLKYSTAVQKKFTLKMKELSGNARIDDRGSAHRGLNSVKTVKPVSANL